MHILDVSDSAMQNTIWFFLSCFNVKFKKFLDNIKKIGRFFHIFVDFPEYLNFKTTAKNKNQVEAYNLTIFSNRETCPVPLANALE